MSQTLYRQNYPPSLIMEDTTIWRYVDFTKLVDLLLRKAIFFSRADLLGDPFEGSVPWKHYGRKYGEITDGGEKIGGIEVMWRGLLRHQEEGENFRKSVFVNCWHINEGESAALWKLYLKSDEGIALRSTKERLSRALTNSKMPIAIKPIQYIDYQADEVPLPDRMAAYSYKRKSFEHERELRAMLTCHPEESIEGEGSRDNPPGIYVETSLETLIDRIIVSPLAPEWFGQLVLHTVQRLEAKIEVQASSLSYPDPKFI